VHPSADWQADCGEMTSGGVSRSSRGEAIVREWRWGLRCSGRRFKAPMWGSGMGTYGVGWGGGNA